MNVRWNERLGFRLGSLVLALLVGGLLLVAANLVILDDIQGEYAWMQRASRGPELAYRMAYLAERARAQTGPEQQRLLADLEETFRQMDARYDALVTGAPGEGIPAEMEEHVVAPIRQRRAAFEREVKPLVRARARAPQGTEETPGLLAGITGEFVRETETGVAEAQRLVSTQIARLRSLQLLFGGLLIAVVASSMYLVLGIVRRVRNLSETAARISAGELSTRPVVEGSDEVTYLAQSFDRMTTGLREKIAAEERARRRIEEVLTGVRDTAQQLAAATAEIAAATKEQASASQQQASAVYQTLTAADQVARTSEQAAGRAKSVAESARQSDEIGKKGRSAIGEAVSTMNRAKSQSDTIAEGILALAEQTQAVGDILAAIDDIAEQTHVLSLNAAIEAARAGEQGRGFSVVASEVRGLAQQAKKSTVQVRQILSEIQRTANRAVLRTEEGTRSMSAAVQAATEAGETLRTLLDAISEWAQTANQIAQGAGQQASGLNQINQAIKSISDATNQNLASTRQTEQAATELGSLGSRLRDLVTGSSSAA